MSLSDWVVEEQAILWDDLNNAIGQAINGAWSMQASNVARRIVSAARLVGATPPDSVQWNLVAGGVYQAVLAAGGIAVQLSEAEVASTSEQMAVHVGTLDECRARHAATVATIQTPRETAWINGEDE